MQKRPILVTVAKRAFTLDGSNKAGNILGFLLVFASAGWFINNTAPLLISLGGYLGRKIGLGALGTLGAGALLSLLLFALSLWYVADRVRGEEPAVPTFHLAVPPKMPGLIWMLSPYSSKFGPPQPYGDSNGVITHLNDDDFREQMLCGRWGSLIAAIQHHSDRLEHCWIVCTPGTSGSIADYPAAQKVVHKFALKAKCYDEKLIDANDVGIIATEIDAIYRQAPELCKLEAHQIIADFTGGTAAMSGGMLLATLEHDRRVEYFRQDRPLCPGGKALSRAQILQLPQDQQPLVAVITTPGMVTAHQKPPSEVPD